MYIDEVKGGTDVTVRASNQEGQSLYFVSHIIDKFTEKDDKTVTSAREKLIQKGYRLTIVEAFRDYDAILNFVNGISHGEGNTAAKIYCDATVLQDERPQLFKKVNVLRLNLKDAGAVHMIICANEGEKINRRTEYRLSLNSSATMRINDSHKFHNITVRDISAHGIGVVAPKSCDINIEDEIHLEFYDLHYEKQKRQNVEDLYKLDAHVVRIVDIDEKHQLIGLSVISKGDRLAKLISRKQLERVKLNREQR